MSDAPGIVYWLTRYMMASTIDVTNVKKYFKSVNVNYTAVSKTSHVVTVHYLRQILTDFKDSFTGTFCIQFAITQLLNISPDLECVATLPCEI